MAGSMRWPRADNHNFSFGNSTADGFIKVTDASADEPFFSSVPDIV